MILSRQGDRTVGFVLILNVHDAGASGANVLIGLADTEDAADLGSGLAVGVIVLTVGTADEGTFFVCDSQGFPRNHVDANERIAHGNSPERLGASLDLVFAPRSELSIRHLVRVFCDRRS